MKKNLKTQKNKEINEICIKAKLAEKSASLWTQRQKDKILKNLIKNLKKNKELILNENKKDIKKAETEGLSKAKIQRLIINDKVFNEIINGIKDVIKLKDPVGKILESKKLNNGLKLSKISVPIGTIMIIYESRPNVTIDVAALCIKSGNSLILKGGSESLKSNLALMKCIKESLLNKDAIIYVSKRELIKDLLKMNNYINLVIPRGGKNLIEFVVENAKMPVIKHYEGICNIYIDEKVNFNKAIDIIKNSKIQKPSACNAVENLLVNKKIAEKFLPLLKYEMDKSYVELKGCSETRKIINIKKATEKDFRTEYLANILSIKIVNNVNEAINFINTYGSQHSDAIITENKKNVKEFLLKVDSAAVYHNASTRFTDGGQFGMGCEMGISTDKLHVRGPMGLRELCSYKYICKGNYLVRK
jgi:glutamate-5-semialdehyde dehydrogenase